MECRCQGDLLPGPGLEELLLWNSSHKPIDYHNHDERIRTRRQDAILLARQGLECDRQQRLVLSQELHHEISPPTRL